MCDSELVDHQKRAVGFTVNAVFVPEALLWIDRLQESNIILLITNKRATALNPCALLFVSFVNCNVSVETEH